MSTARSNNVYVIRGHGRIKVGHSVKPEKRLSELRNATPEKLTLVRRFPCDPGRAFERLVHELLKPWKMRGEWFSCETGAVDVAVEAIRSGCNRRVRYLKLRAEADAAERRWLF